MISKLIRFIYHRSKDSSSDMSSFKLSTPLSMANQTEYGMYTTLHLTTSHNQKKSSKLSSNTKSRVSYNTVETYGNTPIDLKTLMVNKPKAKHEESNKKGSQNKSFKNTVKNSKSISKNAIILFRYL